MAFVPAIRTRISALPYVYGSKNRTMASRTFHTTKKRIGPENPSHKSGSKPSVAKNTESASIARPTAFNPISWYSEKLKSHPLTTKCVTSGIIAGSADLICQYTVYRGKPNEEESETFIVDWMRTGRFGLLGFGLVAPVVHHWYGFLMKMIPGQSITNVLKRLFCDQVLFAPLFISSFMTSLMTLEGNDLKQISLVLERDLANVVVSNWSLWVPAMYLNFKFVPIQWQVLYSNCVGFVWNIYLSWKTQEDGKN